MRFIGALLGLVLAAPAAAQGMPDQRLGSPLIRQDQYSPTIDVVSAQPEGHEVGKGDFEAYMLVGKIDKKTGEVSVAVQWDRIYVARDWRSYQRAADSSGTPLVFKTVRRTTKGCGAGGCTFDELYAIYFTKEQLAAAVVEGLDFKIWNRDGGTALVKIPASAIKEFGVKMLEAEKLRTH